ncbi:prepilin peptidase [Candidatus Viridilinea mediisalina]|uniref:Prepilin peptidase n=1 Tax=Candidatus Viridilinea mediisalina TaxID=2024553 RepID=A0A2A6RMZ8_9CHLR|nr:prepilin peptidase [Candidatus Viridilinea mediisalina]PDW04454.1 prepilin peptidase [Candidatus Viridilinea mediisalina]
MLTSTALFLIGLGFGTLLNILIVRLPRERRLLGWPRCTRTGEALLWWQLLPLVGWLLQRGRARDGRSLHWIHPLVELLSGLMLLRLYQLYEFTPAFFYLSFVCGVLLLTGAIDWIHRYIYTFVILGAALLALIIGPLVGMDWRNVLLGALLGGFIFLLFYLLARVLFPSTAVPFGLGDVYLAIFIGAVVGMLKLGTALFYGMAMAGVVSAGILLVRRTGRPTPTYIAYGSYLCLGVLLFIALGGMGV